MFEVQTGLDHVAKRKKIVFKCHSHRFLALRDLYTEDLNWKCTAYLFSMSVLDPPDV